MKVQKQADSTIWQPETGQQLGFRNRGEFLHRPDFSSNRITHDTIRAVSTITLDLLVKDGPGSLLFGTKATATKLKSEASFVGGFEQTRADDAIDVQGAADNLPGS
jgi:hypothetical protein